MTPTTLRGMSTLRFHADDLAAARRWYTAFLGIEPYFVKAEYIEFRLGDSQHELGILDRRFNPPGPAGAAGAVVYWHVDDVHGTHARLLALGAAPREAPRDFGHGFVGASVVDPFGNVLGVMFNPHYVEMQALARDPLPGSSGGGSARNKPG